MPRGPVGGATAALIQALAEQGVRVSRYQIERWRATGDLPRPVRHGRGRGRGVVSETPDEQTVMAALLLARESRQGSRRIGGHVLERLAVGRAVREVDVRRAVTTVLDEVARMVGADVVDPDAGWQARRAIAARAARDAVPAGWQELLAAVDGRPARPDLPRDRKRAAVAGMVHALGGGAEAQGDEMIEMMGLLGGVTQEQAAQLRDAQRNAELRGDDPWGHVAEVMSMRNLRQAAAAATLDQLRRATAVVLTVAPMQFVVVMFGMLDLVGSRIDLGERLNRFDGAMVRALQADPMWPLANMMTLDPRPRRWIRQLVLTALGILIAGNLLAWEAYRDRLLQLTHMDPPAQPSPVGLRGGLGDQARGPGRAVAVPDDADESVRTAAVQAVRVEIPGKVASHLADRPDLGEAEQHALRRGRMVRRGRGYSLHLTAVPEVHQALLAAAAALDTDGASSADRKAYRIYSDRLRLAAQIAALPADSRPGLPTVSQYDVLLHSRAATS